jgi:preprotein translocase subunit YajC
MNIAVLEGSQGSPMGTLIMFGLMFVVVYFFMLRPQSKKRKKEEEDRKNIAKGDKVITIGGIYGKVTKVDDETVIIVSQDTKIRVAKSAITLDPDQSSSSSKGASKDDSEEVEDTKED